MQSQKNNTASTKQVAILIFNVVSNITFKLNGNNDGWADDLRKTEEGSDISSDESPKELNSLHKFMSPALPLPERNAYQILEAKTAFKIEFRY